ncbi:GMC oxidoreductase [Hebeloma cylindrosporum]|uniref:pyranose dehydrogenase (acceptor) n=1 Tax=Hebeloma cylindrosporum TaxID=76867 RepID=A0A0C3CJ71_HEBCY|nr:GMC oxidoreductase [Hebeloma cylindrosporum h7]
MLFLCLIGVVLSTLLVTPSSGVILTQPSQLITLEYDYIIIGAGTAGLVVANRLTEDTKITVLVLEAGVSDEGVVPAIAPFLATMLTPNTAYDWNYTVVPQKGMHGRTFSYPRGRLLGGSSSANYNFHQYGSAEDWDRYAKETGDPGWAWNNVKKYIKKHEKIVPSADGHDTSGQFIPSLHGSSGEVSVSLPGFNLSIDARVMATTGQLSEFPYNEDTSGGDHSLLGIGFVQSSIGKGVRSSSSTSYLANANSRPNLTVLINATVVKLLQSGTKGALKSFRSVQFSSSPDSVTMTVKARKEVILSAGTIGTTQILQLSGIGNASDLKALNIPVLVDNPAVGANLIDHVYMPNVFNAQESLDTFLRDSSRLGAAIEEWTTNKTGIIANNVANTFGFARLPSNSSIFKAVADPASGPKSPHWEMIFSNFWTCPGIARPATGKFMTIVTALISPTSRGTIKLRSTNPFDKPLIDPNYLTTEFDIVVLRESVKASKRIVAAPAWADYVISPFGRLSATSDVDIDNYIRGAASTVFHPVGTAAMSSSGSKSGVVNENLLVKGADGLRIVDASVFPFIPSVHTQGPVYLLAERASDLIKADQLYPSAERPPLDEL